MSATTTRTVDLNVVEETPSGESSASVSPQMLRIKLKAKTDDKNNDQKKVKFTEETVDNEGMDRKKSKCCCIYHKPHTFDQSSDSSDSEGETDHCYGHKSCK